MKKVLFFILILCFFGNITVSASLAGARPSKIELENVNKFFYMTPLGYLSVCTCGNEHLPSGLYYNTDPPKIIYLINSHYTERDVGYFSSFNIISSSDGMYFAHFPLAFEKHHPGISAEPGTVLEFYAHGNLVKRYNVSQLVQNDTQLMFGRGVGVNYIIWERWRAKREQRLRLADDIRWRIRQIKFNLDVFGGINQSIINNTVVERPFNAEDNTLSITTVDNITYTFDITTGNIISIGKPLNSIPIIFFLTATFTVVMRKHKRNIRYTE